MIFAVLALSFAQQTRPVTTPVEPPKKPHVVAPKPPAKQQILPIFVDELLGSGPPAGTGDLVTVHFVAKRKGETVADSDRRGLPFTFRVGDAGNEPLLESVVKGMRLGGIRSARVNAKSVYGVRGAPPLIAPGDVLQVSVRLIARSSK